MTERMGHLVIEIDDRPRCLSTGRLGDDEIPCDKHEGHDDGKPPSRRKHEWARPMSFTVYEWTDARPTARKV